MPFVGQVPWKEKRCQAFGGLASERDLRLSVHALVRRPDLARRGPRPAMLAALEHTMKLGEGVVSASDRCSFRVQLLRRSLAC